MAIRKDLIICIKYLSDENMVYICHDSLMWRLAGFLDGAYYLEKNVIRYRIHDKNASGITTDVDSGNSTLRKRYNLIERWIKIIDILLKTVESIDTYNKEYKMFVYNKTLRLSKLRIALLKQKEWIRIPQLFFNYRYYPSFLVFFGDIAYFFNINKFVGSFLKSFRKYVHET
jgi:hypothetical protein